MSYKYNVFAKMHKKQERSLHFFPQNSSMYFENEEATYTL